MLPPALVLAAISSNLPVASADADDAHARVVIKLGKGTSAPSQSRGILPRWQRWDGGSLAQLRDPGTEGDDRGLAYCSSPLVNPDRARPGRANEKQSSLSFRRCLGPNGEHLCHFSQFLQSQYFKNHPQSRQNPEIRRIGGATIVRPTFAGIRRAVPATVDEATPAFRLHAAGHEKHYRRTTET
jgi:hypothetical protein